MLQKVELLGLTLREASVSLEGHDTVNEGRTRARVYLESASRVKSVSRSGVSSRSNGHYALDLLWAHCGHKKGYVPLLKLPTVQFVQDPLAEFLKSLRLIGHLLPVPPK